MERQQLAAEPACACESGTGFCARCYAVVEREVWQAQLERWLERFGTRNLAANVQRGRPLRLVWSRGE